MSLRVTVLGGSAAWPNPGQGCSAYLIRSAGASLLVDCGPDTMLELRNHVSPTALDAVVISHCHADHILDLVTLRYGLVYGRDELATPIPVWLPPGGEAIVRKLGDALGGQGEGDSAFWDNCFTIREYDPDGELAIEDCRLRFRATQHFTRCYAIRVQSGGKTLVYSADTGRFDHLIDFAQGADLLISEATADDHGDLPPEERGHMTPEDAGDWAREADVRRLLLTHLWHERPVAKVVGRAAARYAGPIDAAARGLTLYV